MTIIYQCCSTVSLNLRTSIKITYIYELNLKSSIPLKGIENYLCPQYDLRFFTPLLHSEKLSPLQSPNCFQLNFPFKYKSHIELAKQLYPLQSWSILGHVDNIRMSWPVMQSCTCKTRLCFIGQVKKGNNEMRKKKLVARLRKL